MKKGKSKKNWFKVQFEKHPYLYTFVIGWIILIFISAFLLPVLESKFVQFGYFGYPDNDVLSIIFDVPVFILLLSPFIIFFLWFRMNKSKIKPFFKKRKKILKPIFYTVGGIISFAAISLIITIIILGGFANFKERAKFEYLAWDNKYDCSQTFYYTGYGEYSKFFWKLNTQFIDYFQYKPYTVVKNVVSLKDNFLYNFNHCKAVRYLLRAAHQDHKVAKDILAAYPGEYFYSDDFDLFKRYRNLIDEKKLYNAALVNAFANKTDGTSSENYLLSVEKRRELHKEAAEEGYLLGMQDYLWTFGEEKGKRIDKSECHFILKYSKHLYEQESLMASAAAAFALIGKTSMETTRVIYECSDKKTDFAKAILLFKEFNNKTAKPKKTSNFVSTYPAIIYFNGWGNVEKDQKLAYELFSVNNEYKYGSEISKAYLAFVKLNSPNTENHKKGLKLLNKMFDRGDYTSTHDIYCNNIKYDFRNKEEREKVSLCLSEASNDERINSVKSYIKLWIENWFKNPEIVKTLNLYG